jgi:hypothetical protein
MMGRYSYDIFPLKISHARLHILLMLAHKISAGNIFRYLLCNFLFYCKKCGSGSSVGIATDYGLDGPGSNPGRDEIFCPSRLALGPTQPPVK